MSDLPQTSRRELLQLAGGAGLLSLVGANSAAAADSPPPKRTFRIGVVSAAIHGKPQPHNGHTWHFAQYLHPTCDLDAMKRLYPYAHDYFKKTVRNPKLNFDMLPFPDTKITHYYDADPSVIGPFTEVFPGVKAAKSLEEMVQEVDAIWMGDASGYGEDHFDLVAPGLAKGLPTFCDKPIGGDAKGTKKILDFAKQHKAPIMSSSLFRHEFGMEAALRMRDSGEFGPIEHITATLHSRYALNGWMIYGQHPVWTVMTLMGPGVDAVSMYEYKDTCHALITWKDRYPCHVWYGEPFEKFEYCRTTVHFKKKIFQFTPSIEGSFDVGHHYEMFRMAATFRQMLLTGVEPVPHQEILEVTAIVHAGAKSLKEKGRLVELAEVMG
ncbi:MAG: Gfo/Idh/MocA family oxidoreductase [Planctomycetaceae bacterium]|nr:Gfo/Idh/MocA family oxidoreductase [Planctomycetaceae bacterium]